MYGEWWESQESSVRMELSKSQRKVSRVVVELRQNKLQLGIVDIAAEDWS